MACPLGNSQSLESQSGLYSAIRNRLTTQSKPDLRYMIFEAHVTMILGPILDTCEEEFFF